ncbi:UDP-N-acetylmuramoyl-L-alanine--D-glutamate ligase [Acanthopleuribacter pedis]|nr:UDP-N-acetylmuramoyl-L-alanine--D-glutamate ligase [Acanthopleuribacter pedis]
MKPVMVAGLGRSGLAVVDRLKAEGLPFVTYDDREAMAEGVEGTQQHYQHAAAVDWSSVAELVVSPGMAITHPLIIAAGKAGVSVISELEFAFRRCRGTLVAVTGSNGKSTTVSLIHHLLETAGRAVRLGGNIGTAFSAIVDDREDVVYVVEVSSFQLEHVQTFRPDIGVILNVSADHLDRHGDLATYRAVKEQLFARQNSEDLALAAPELAAGLPGDARTLALPNRNDTLTEHALRVSGLGYFAYSLNPLLVGPNRTNALFACVVARALGLDGASIRAALASFAGLEHRMERVGTVANRLWINDTKATNVHAAQAGIDAMQGKYVLILGGSDKGERFDGLKLAQNPPQHIVAYGETAPSICADLADFQPVRVDAFDAACREAHRLAAPDSVVLLSPACASFDQFQSFVHRGLRFKQLFSQIDSSTAPSC